MAVPKRVIVRKVYTGKAALFGLLYGALSGVVLGSVFYLMLLFGLSAVSDSFNLPVNAGIELFFAVILLIFLYTIACCFFAIISAALYNLISRMGGGVHLSLADYEYIST